MRIIFMGTGPFAVPTFQSVADSEHQVVVLVTKPSATVRSRGKSPGNPMREAALEKGVSILTPENINQQAVLTQLAALRPDLYVVCDYGQILGAPALAVPRLGGINLHGSLLPRYRGAAPVQWAILEGDVETGTSVIHMTPKLDAGPCLTQRRLVIGDQETAPELESRLAEDGITAVGEAIALLADWDGKSAIGIQQSSQKATRAPRLKKSDGEVDWTSAAEHISRQVRALKPWPGTFTHWHRKEGKPLRLILDRVVPEPAEKGASEPGTVARSSSTELVLATGEGWLRVETVQPAGKRTMPVEDFLRGHAIRPGARFGKARL